MQGVTSAEIKIKNKILADASDDEYNELQNTLNCKTGMKNCWKNFRSNFLFNNCENIYF